jgi:hypothetical protein
MNTCFYLHPKIFPLYCCLVGHNQKIYVLYKAEEKRNLVIWQLCMSCDIVAGSKPLDRFSYNSKWKTLFVN